MKSLFLLLAAAAAFASDRPSTIYIDRMNGFETYVATAIQHAEIGLSTVLETARPELKVTMGKRVSGYAEVLYQQKLGRKNETVLTVIDTATGKRLLNYEFHLPGDEDGRQRAAREFAEALKKKLAKR